MPQSIDLWYAVLDTRSPLPGKYELYINWCSGYISRVDGKPMDVDYITKINLATMQRENVYVIRDKETKETVTAIWDICTSEVDLLTRYMEGNA